MQWKFELEYNGVRQEMPEPVGWDSVGFQVKRDAKVFGLTFEFSTEVKWYQEAREFVQNAFDMGNVDAVVSVNVYRRASEFDAWVLFYTGVLSMKDVKIDEKFSIIRIEQSGFRKSFLGQRDLDVSLEKTKEIRAHSKLLKKKSLFEYDEGFRDIDWDRVLVTNSPSTFLPLVFATNTEFETVLDITDFFKEGTAASNAPDAFVRASQAGQALISARLKGRIVITWQFPITGVQDFNSDSWKFFSAYGASAISNITERLHVPRNTWTESLNRIEKEFDFSYTESITLNQGDRYWLFFSFANFTLFNGGQPGLVDIRFEYDSESYLDIEVDTLSPSTAVKGVMAFDAFNQIVENYTGIANRFKSDFLSSGLGQYLFITNGFLLRGLEDKPLYANFEKLFDAVRVIYNLGFAVRVEDGLEVVRVEPQAFFYDAGTELMYLPNPERVERSPAMDFYFNKIVIGYDKWQDDAVGQINGLDEYNSQRQYSTSLTLGEFRDEERNRRELNLVVKGLITSGYLIEYVRRLAGKATTDSKYDNELFGIMLNQSEVTSDKYGEGEQVYAPLSVSERNEVFEIANVIDPDSVYNVRLAPGYILRRWMPHISGQLVKDNENKKLVSFRSGEGNFEMISRDLNDVWEAFGQFSERENIEANLVDFKPVFEAEWLDLDYKVSFTQFLAVMEGMSGYVAIDLGNRKVAGFIDTLDFSPTKASGLKLLRRFAEIAHLTIDKLMLDFGDVTIGEVVCRTLRLKNISDNLYSYAVLRKIIGDSEEVSGVLPFGGVQIAPGVQYNQDVCFEAAEPAGARQGIILLKGDFQHSPLLVEYVANVVGLQRWVFRFDGVNDALLANDFTVPATTAPWTLFLSFRSDAQSGTQTIFAPVLTSTAGSRIRGIVVEINYSSSLFIVTHHSAFNRRHVANYPIPTADVIVQVSYDGSRQYSGYKVYYNNILQTRIVGPVNTLDAAMQETVTNCNVGSLKISSVSTINYFAGIIREVSWVDYEKSSAQIAADFSAGTQELGTGAWILNPLKPIYAQSGAEQITSLDSTIQLNTVPAFIMLGKANPLTLGADLELIQ